ncbi:MAG: hypothetical protein AAF652_09195 [Cyanobacteria bacterium P01_C01_bin.72]
MSQSSNAKLFWVSIFELIEQSYWKLASELADGAQVKGLPCLSTGFKQ